MSQIINIAVARVGYDVNDTVRAVGDNHVWGSEELDTSKWTIITGLDLTQDDITKLEMTGERYAELEGLPSDHSVRELRRVYQWVDGAVILKPTVLPDGN